MAVRSGSQIFVFLLAVSALRPACATASDDLDDFLSAIDALDHAYDAVSDLKVLVSLVLSTTTDKVTGSSTFSSPSSSEVQSTLTTSEMLTSITSTDKTTTQELVTTTQEISTTTEPATTDTLTTDKATSTTTSGQGTSTAFSTGGSSTPDSITTKQTPASETSTKLIGSLYMASTKEMLLGGALKENAVEASLPGHRRYPRSPLAFALSHMDEGENVSSTSELPTTTSELSTSQAPTHTSTDEPTTLTTTTEEPDLRSWSEKVEDTLLNIGNLTVEMREGYFDENQPERLDAEATFLDELVSEGAENTSLVLELPQGTIDLIYSTSDTLEDVEEDIREKINEIEAFITKTIVTIVLISVFFVIILIVLIVSLVCMCRRRSRKRRMRSRVVRPDETFGTASFNEYSRMGFAADGSATKAV